MNKTKLTGVFISGKYTYIVCHVFGSLTLEVSTNNLWFDQLHLRNPRTLLILPSKPLKMVGTYHWTSIGSDLVSLTYHLTLALVFFGLRGQHLFHCPDFILVASIPHLVIMYSRNIHEGSPKIHLAKFSLMLYFGILWLYPKIIKVSHLYRRFNNHVIYVNFNCRTNLTLEYHIDNFWYVTSMSFNPNGFTL